MIPISDYNSHPHGSWYLEPSRALKRLYRELTYGNGPLTRIQPEMVAVVVSGEN
ncbi:MAG: hypothetical protein HQ508_06115 [Candidatus Marinimicrobia bacterium]|nr:hypothetical protein [Candidatus Neomarinimicrobiota bacterium]